MRWSFLCFRGSHVEIKKNMDTITSLKIDFILTTMQTVMKSHLMRHFIWVFKKQSSCISVSRTKRNQLMNLRRVFAVFGSIQDEKKSTNEYDQSEDSDQPGHPPSLIRVCAVRSVGNYGTKRCSSRQQKLQSFWATDVQTKSDSDVILCF